MPASKPRTLYVETHAGWRAFFLCVLVAACLGAGFRLYFSPARLSAWVSSALERQKAGMKRPFAMSFGEASLRLRDSSGYWPQLAVVVTHVRLAPNPQCRPEASVFIGELRLPFRLRSLLAGRAAVGLIEARDLIVDLDGLRAHCLPSTESATANASIAETAQALSTPRDETEARTDWWTPQQFETVRGFIEGFQFSRATLQFENKTKEIYLDSFRAQLKSNQRVELATELRVPPPTSFQEQLPPLRIEGQATSAHAQLAITARVSEGSLRTEAILTPENNQHIHIAARAVVKSLPLSMLSPLMRKSGLANEKFQPKNLWLDCQASIEGRFQGLFQSSPLEITACRIEGDQTDLWLERATRLPNATWKPFDVKVRSLRLAKLFETVGVRGPEGVANEFGVLSGDIQVKSDHVARFEGRLRRAQIQFSNRKTRAAQLVESAELSIEIDPKAVTARVPNAILKNGTFVGRLHVDLDKTLKRGTAKMEIERLKLDPDVQRVLVGGSLGEIEGNVSARIDEGRVKDFSSSLSLGATEADQFDFQTLNVRAQRKEEEPPLISMDAGEIELKDGLKRGLENALFARDANSPLLLEQLRFEFRVLGDGDLEWSKASAKFDGRRAEMRSSGVMNRDREISATLTIDYPRVKNLKFRMHGKPEALNLEDDSEELRALRSRAEINRSDLGL